VTGANRHDVSQLEAVLDNIVVKRVQPPKRRSKHLCADAGYTGAPARAIIDKHGYIPHVKGRGQEARELKRDPAKKARRWVVEVAHSWFNRFRKGALREVGPQLHRVESSGRIHHDVQKNQTGCKYYLRISSKAVELYDDKLMSGMLACWHSRT
jgi:IS5 family transposase